MNGCEIGLKGSLESVFNRKIFYIYIDLPYSATKCALAEHLASVALPTESGFDGVGVKTLALLFGLRLLCWRKSVFWRWCIGLGFTLSDKMSRDVFVLINFCRRQFHGLNLHIAE